MRYSSLGKRCTAVSIYILCGFWRVVTVLKYSKLWHCRSGWHSKQTYLRPFVEGVWSTKNTLPVRQLTLGYLSTHCKQQQVMTEEEALPSSGWGRQGCTDPCWLGRPTLGQWQKYPKMRERQAEGIAEIHITWAAWIRIEALARKLQNTHKDIFMDSCNSTAQKDRATKTKTTYAPTLHR